MENRLIIMGTTSRAASLLSHVAMLNHSQVRGAEAWRGSIYDIELESENFNLEMRRYCKKNLRNTRDIWQFNELEYPENLYKSEDSHVGCSCMVEFETRDEINIWNFIHAHMFLFDNNQVRRLLTLSSEKRDRIKLIVCTRSWLSGAESLSNSLPLMDVPKIVTWVHWANLQKRAVRNGKKLEKKSFKNMLNKCNSLLCLIIKIFSLKIKWDL
jgi:hypothetical protein